MSAVTNLPANWFRHFFVATGGLFYIGSMLMLLYQYLGLTQGWPGVFLSVIYDDAGDWWLDIDWASPALWGFVAAILSLAALHGWRLRRDFVPYREPEVKSQPGF
ncbi:MAG: hypothetical protein V3573_03715 [Desulfovibrionaceae bacterium]